MLTASWKDCPYGAGRGLRRGKIGNSWGQGNVNYIYSSFEEHKVTFIVFADEQRGFIVYPGQSMLCF